MPASSAITDCVIEHQGTPVQGIGRHAADHREQEDRTDPRQPDDAERQRPLSFRREQRDVPEQGRRLHEGAGKRQQQPRPQETEIAVTERSKHAHSIYHPRRAPLLRAPGLQRGASRGAIIEGCCRLSSVARVVT